MRARTLQHINTRVDFDLIERLNRQAKNALEDTRVLLNLPDNLDDTVDVSFSTEGLVMFPMLRIRSPRFLKSEDGTATVESLLWFMAFMLVFFLTFDSAMMFKAQTDVVRITQDANRLASIGRLVTAAQTEAYVEDRLEDRLPNANATTTINSFGVIRTIVEFPASDVGKIGWYAAFDNLMLTVSADHLKEDFL